MIKIHITTASGDILYTGPRNKLKTKLLWLLEGQYTQVSVCTPEYTSSTGGHYSVNWWVQYIKVMP